MASKISFNSDDFTDLFVDVCRCDDSHVDLALAFMGKLVDNICVTQSLHTPPCSELHQNNGAFVQYVLFSSVNNIPFQCESCDTFSACAECIRVLATYWAIETRNQLL